MRSIANRLGPGLFNASRTLRRIRDTLGWKSGGVYKRIDENRELLELLNSKTPEFVKAHPWVVGWLESNDEFLTQLAVDVPVSEGQFIPGQLNTASVFPRQWPESVKC